MTHHGNEGLTHRFWCRAYRALLPLMPHGLRERQGDAMLELFDRELRLRTADGRRAVWIAGCMGLADLVRRGVYERLSEERHELTTANLATLRQTALAFLMSSAVLTALLVARGAMTRDSALVSGTALEAIALSVPYTAALTIPMSVFIAVLWAAARARRGTHTDGSSDARGRLRIAPAIGMASVVALCCLALNAELVPRANLRLQAIYAGEITVAPSDRSMTLVELRAAEATIARASLVAPASPMAGERLRGFQVEIHKKLALAAACVVLALLAAGIAGRAPRLGIWAQAGISLVVFAGYYVCIIAGEQLADRSAIPPALDMWSANIVALVLATLTLRVGRRAAAPTVPPPASAH